MTTDTSHQLNTNDPWQVRLIIGFAFFGGFLLSFVSIFRGNYAEYVIPPALLFATLYFLRSKMTTRAFWRATPPAFAISMLGFAVLSAIGAYRTTALGGSLNDLKPFVFPVIFYLAAFTVTFFFMLQDRQLNSRILAMVFWGWVVGFLILTAEFSTQFLSTYINSVAGPNTLADSDYNRAIIFLAALSWLAVPFARLRFGLVGSILPVVLIWLLSMASQSQTVQIGLPVALAFYLAALWLPRLVSGALIFGSAALLAGAPWIYQMLYRIAPGVTGLNESIFLVRAEIWDGVARLALKAPLFGQGFYTTRRAGYSLVEHTYFFPTTAYHPHNVFLEIWADLGFAGVIFGLMFIYALGRGLRALEPPVLPAAIGATTMVLLVLLLSHSFWSAWLLGFLAFLAGFMLLVNQSFGDSSDAGASSP